MSQLTTAKVDGIEIGTMVQACSEVANKIYHHLIKEVDLKATNASKLKELDEVLTSKRRKDRAERKAARSQIDEVLKAMNNVEFVNLNEKEKMNLGKALVVKHTVIANFADSKDIQQVITNEDVNILDIKWNKLVEEVKIQKVNETTNHIFQSLSEVGRGLNFVEKEKVINPGGNSYVKLTDEFGHCVTMVTETKKGKTKMSIEPSGYDTKTKGCKHISDKILKSLKKKGLSLYDVKILDHNNQSGLLNIRLKKKATRVLELVHGTIKKSSAKRLANTQKTRFLK